MNAPAPPYGPAGPPPLARPVSGLAALRDAHHRIAALLAAWASPDDVAQACRLSPAHVRTLAHSPAMVELVAAKRSQTKAA